MWKARYDTARQYWYYYNTMSGEATWNRPHDYTDRPSDFEEKFDAETDRNYYYNKLTQESSWEIPSCWRGEGAYPAPIPPSPPTPPPAIRKQPKPTSLREFLAKKGGGERVCAEFGSMNTQSEFVDNSKACCGVRGCTGCIHNGGLCQTHYEIHLLDIGERRRGRSGFEGLCAKCSSPMFKAGFCKGKRRRVARRRFEKTLSSLLSL